MSQQDRTTQHSANGVGGSNNPAANPGQDKPAKRESDQVGQQRPEDVTRGVPIRRASKIPTRAVSGKRQPRMCASTVRDASAMASRSSLAPKGLASRTARLGMPSTSSKGREEITTRAISSRDASSARIGACWSPRPDGSVAWQTATRIVGTESSVVSAVSKWPETATEYPRADKTSAAISASSRCGSRMRTVGSGMAQYARLRWGAAEYFFQRAMPTEWRWHGLRDTFYPCRLKEKE